VVDPPEQDGFWTALHPFWQPVPQNSEVVPQNLPKDWSRVLYEISQRWYTYPNWEQHTFSGHRDLPAGAYCPHSACALQELVQFPDPQYVGPKPQKPLDPQHPDLHGEEGEQVPWVVTDEKNVKKDRTRSNFAYKE
jgi:hypothetical protein